MPVQRTKEPDASIRALRLFLLHGWSVLGDNERRKHKAEDQHHSKPSMFHFCSTPMSHCRFTSTAKLNGHPNREIQWVRDIYPTKFAKLVCIFGEPIWLSRYAGVPAYRRHT